MPGSNKETYQLNERITILEHRVDSLTKARSIDSVEKTITGVVLTDARCQAITKKGTQCRRKAKNNNYCWQHGK